MHDPDNQVETLVQVASAMEAAMIVSVLAGEEIDATTAGDFTAGFRAEAPGVVSVLVRKKDLEHAQGILAAYQGKSPGTNLQSSEKTNKPWLIVGILLLVAVALILFL